MILFGPKIDISFLTKERPNPTPCLNDPSLDFDVPYISKIWD